MNRVRLGVAAVFLLGSVGMGASCRNGRTNPPPVQAEGGDAAAARPTPTIAAGSSLVTEVEGLDLHALSSAERESFWAVANDELSTCGDPHSLAVCARDRLACRTCLPALRFLARRVQDGMRREDLSEALRARYAASAAQQIRLEGAPSHGSVTAAVTVVEFSDYECPHCAHAVPVLRTVAREFEGRVRMVHMNFPLSGHIHAMPAARAALAAGRQNKFWEMNDLLFQNREHLEPADLDRYATQLGLDLNRFHTDAASPEIEAAIAATRREGERLQIQGTPTIYINGRRYELPVQREPLREWIQDELDLINQR
ncbi:MAG: thioredoxin domain-containing protein [Myxococcales bacterium]|nr:thioredoxin domain-containing protein [Myxococcales bacterium]